MNIDQIIGPPPPETGTGLNSDQDMLTNVLFRMLEENNRGKKELSGLPAQILGGGLNLIGSIFGADEIGTDLLGSRKKDNSIQLAQLLVSLSGIKEEANTRKDMMKFQAAQEMEMNKLRTELEREKIALQGKIHTDRMALEEKLTNTQIKARQDELVQKYKNDQALVSLDQKSKTELAKVMAKLELDKLDKVTDSELLMIEEKLKGESKLAFQKILGDRFSRLAEIGASRNIMLEEINAKIEGQLKILEAENKNKKAENETKNIPTEEDIAKTQKAKADADKASTELVRQQLTHQGKLIKGLDTISSKITETNGAPSILLEAKGWGIRHLASKYLDKAISSDEDLPNDVIDGVYKHYADKVELALQSGKGVDSIGEELKNDLNSGLSQIKDIMQSPEVADSLDEATYTELDSMSTKFKKTVESILDEAIVDGTARFQVEDSFRKLQHMVRGDDALSSLASEFNGPTKQDDQTRKILNLKYRDINSADSLVNMLKGYRFTDSRKANDLINTMLKSKRYLFNED